MINKVLVSDRIHRARDEYLAQLERQTQALAELPTDLEPLARLVAVDRILGDCAQALDALAEQLPGAEQADELGPELWADIEEFRQSIEVVRKTIAPGRQPILANIAALQPEQN